MNIIDFWSWNLSTSVTPNQLKSYSSQLSVFYLPKQKTLFTDQTQGINRMYFIKIIIELKFYIKSYQSQY